MNILLPQAVFVAVFHEAFAGIDHEDAAARVAVFLINHDDAGGDASAVEEVGPETNHRIDRQALLDMAQDYAEAWYESGPTKRLASLDGRASIMHADALTRFAESLNPFVGYWIGYGPAEVDVYEIRPTQSGQTTVGLRQASALNASPEQVSGRTFAQGTLGFSEENLINLKNPR